MPIPSDSGATLAARGQRRPGTTPTPEARLSGPAPLERVSASLPGPLGRLPAAALFAWVGVVAVAAMVILAVSLRSAKAIEILEEDEAPAASVSATGSASAPPPTATATAKPAIPRAQSGELSAAKLAGAEALAQLAQRFPEDPAVLKELFIAQAEEKKTHLASLRAARRLIEVSPAAVDDEDVTRTLVALANGSSDASPVALDLMSDMGKRGVELIFEVANGNVMMAKAKAAKLLADPDVRRNASPGLLMANDLRASLPCARKTLLARAKTEADARSLPFLKPLLNTACGGFFRRGGAECYRCFTPAERTEIQAVVDAIEARSPAPGATAAASAAPKASAAP